GVGQRMELGNGWSWATDGVGQRMELGNGWSWATDGVINYQLSMPYAPCPMPNPQFPNYSFISLKVADADGEILLK
ncbi:MAG: hypothetical protein WBF90_22930, partial [Rivularia sp. (in: cyanobacteria)]